MTNALLTPVGGKAGEAPEADAIISPVAVCFVCGSAASAPSLFLLLRFSFRICFFEQRGKSTMAKIITNFQMRPARTGQKNLQGNERVCSGEGRGHNYRLFRPLCLFKLKRYYENG